MEENVSRSAHYLRRAIQWLIIIGVIALLSVGVFNIIQQQLRPKQMVAIGNASVQAEVVDTPEARAKGLSGRSSISSEEGMLFVFGEDKEWAIWMKEMKFPIDIVWLDSDKKVVHFAENIQPDAEPYVEYKPPLPTRYVLELQAGKVKQADIRIGAQANFDLDRGK